ncbi:DnaJ-domain-containing protein [Acephala macrosclerotiorum]|nr:DnaJ-domain-containing protein [Acephala macrosclerotiorum]
MAPTAITHDYYAVLEVEQTATLGEIIKSYKRLALLRHPDRNTTRNTTDEFQLLGAAYETLKDESKRRNYDLIYPQIKNTRTPPRPTPQTPRPAPGATKSNQDDTTEATASISAILRAKQERFASWSRTQKVYDDSIFELRREITRLQSVIRKFEDIEKAERAEEAAAKSWSKWLLSPLYQKPVETEERKEQKARDRLLRFHIKNFRERDLQKKELERKELESLLRTKRQEFDNANKKDDIAKSAIEERIRAKRERERQEKERLEREELQRAWKAKLEKMQREAARAERERTERQEKERMEREEMQRVWKEQFEKRRKEAARAARERAELQEKQATERKKREQAEEAARKERAEEIRKRQEAARASEAFQGNRKGQEQPATCRHDAWWPKLEGRRVCEKCSITYGYLLQCPKCEVKTCASCQQTLRPPRRNRKK